MTFEFRRAQVVLNKDKAKEALKIIFGARDDGCFVTRQFMVNAFRQTGYVDRLAEERADQVILVNTDIDHWSRFLVCTQDEQDKYGWHPERLALQAKLNLELAF